MNRTLAINGTACGLIVLVGFLAPRLELTSAPYLSEGVTVRDHLRVNGWNLITGKIQVVQMRSGSQEPVRTIEVHVESKSYPYIDLAGGILLLLGGLTALTSKQRLPYAIVIVGGLLAFVGGSLAFLDNRWIRHAIVIGDYTVYGYYSHGLLLLMAGSLLSIVVSALKWGLSRQSR